jgi:hypothetical protein
MKPNKKDINIFKLVFFKNGIKYEYNRGFISKGKIDLINIRRSIEYFIHNFGEDIFQFPNLK